MSKQESKEKPTGLALLREPFEKHQISKLPKPYKKDSPKGKCSECGGYHGLPAVHLDYVGHAALTDRLLDADPNWNWEPISINEDGSPKFDKDNGLWIRLTVCGVSRLGYGFPDGKTGGNALKETIGDALRNAAMRFGAALDLWHKGDLHAPDEEQEEPKKHIVEKVAEARAANTPVNAEPPGEYVCQFGKFANTAIKDIDPNQLESYLFDYLEQGSKKSGKPMNGKVLEFFNKGSEYLKEFLKDAPPALDSDERLPF